MVSWRHHGRGDAIEKLAEGGSFLGRHPGTMSAADGQRDGKVYSLVLMIPPEVVTAVYPGYGVHRNGRWYGTECSN